MHAEAAASDDSEVRFRALCLAGRAAHIASREQEALELYRRAEAIAPTHVARRDALWGQLLCSIELELPEATEQNANATSRVFLASDAREILQSATYGLGYGSKFGLMISRMPTQPTSLLSAVDDPLVVSSFQSVYSSVLGLAARYDDALRVSEEFLATARPLSTGLRDSLRFDFDRSRAGGHPKVAAKRRTCAAKRFERSRRTRDVCRAAACILGLHARSGSATTVTGSHWTFEMPSLRSALPATRAEVLLSRALVLASVGQS